MPIKFTNNAASSLSIDLSNAATNISVQIGHGDKFPEVSDPDFFYVTVVDGVTGNIEIMKVVSREAGSDNMVVERGYDNTAATTFPAGSYVELRMNAAALEEFVPAENIYTQTAMDTLLSGKSDTGHNHDDTYYTETELDSLLSGKAPMGHDHNATYGQLATANEWAKLQKYPAVNIGTTGAIEWDTAAAPFATVGTMTGDVTLSATGMVGQGFYALVLTPGNYEVSWSSDFQFDKGVAPDTPTNTTLFVFYSNGTNLRGGIFWEYE